MMDVMLAGGPVMMVLLVISLMAAYIFFKRLLELHRAQIKSGDFLKGVFNILSRGNTVEAVSICEETPGPVAQMVRAAILEREKDRLSVLRAMEEAGLAEIPRLEKNLGMLLTLAQAAPLCGLLGTVLGMIQAFSAMQAKAPLIHAGDLGDGMWQALITTAAGLVIGIPTHAGYNFLVSRVESIVLDMERAFGEVLSFLSQLDGNGGR